MKVDQIIDTIAKQKKNSGDRPLENIYMTVTVKEVKRKKITKLSSERKDFVSKTQNIS